MGASSTKIQSFDVESQEAEQDSNNVKDICTKYIKNFQNQKKNKINCNNLT